MISRKSRLRSYVDTVDMSQKRIQVGLKTVSYFVYHDVIPQSKNLQFEGFSGTKTRSKFSTHSLKFFQFQLRSKWSLWNSDNEDHKSVSPLFLLAKGRPPIIECSLIQLIWFGTFGTQPQRLYFILVVSRFWFRGWDRCFINGFEF